MRGFTLFTGGDGVGIAMKSLGVDVVGGIEYIDDIAQVARDNGMNVTTADILQCDPRDFPAMDWLHASPPCPNFSVAKSGATETENDFDLARKVAEWATVHKPRVFSLENVIAYRKSESWKLILNALHEAGYWVHVAHVNFADYGVPQTRKRMIVRAFRGGFVPYLQPTHDKHGREGLPRWIGWYEAIEDLIPTLPTSKFAPWQLKRLPDEFKQSFYSDMQNASRQFTIREDGEPVTTIVSSMARREIGIPRAFLAMPNAGGGKKYRETVEPSDTVVSTPYGGGNKAFVMNEGNPNGNEKRKFRNGDEPIKTVTAGGMVTRGFIVNGTTNDNGESVTVLDESSPVFTQTASMEKRPQRASVNGRVVKMTPRALARFQSFPDWYELPESSTLATRIIGNAVPPVGMANVMRNLII